jgi:hypothetical protein
MPEVVLTALHEGHYSGGSFPSHEVAVAAQLIRHPGKILRCYYEVLGIRPKTLGSVFLEGRAAQSDGHHLPRLIGRERAAALAPPSAPNLGEVGSCRIS